MEQHQTKNGEQNTSTMDSQNIGIDDDVLASTKQATIPSDAASDPHKEMTDIEQLKATVEQLKATIEQFKADNERITASQEQANSKVDQLTAALAEERTNTENKTKIAIDEAISKSQQLVPRNLVVCIDGTSNQFGPKVRSLTFFQTSSYP